MLADDLFDRLQAARANLADAKLSPLPDEDDQDALEHHLSLCVHILRGAHDKQVRVERSQKKSA